jgi:hypothetical protein
MKDGEWKMEMQNGECGCARRNAKCKIKSAKCTEDFGKGI